MSKPDPTGESLESILASIRKSLSEQSTDVLEEEAAPPADAPKGAISGLTRRLAASDDAASLLVDDAPPLLLEEEAAVEALPVDPLPDVASRPQDPLPLTPPPASEVSQAAPPATAQPQKDALWFLGGRGQQAAAESAPPAPAGAPVPPARAAPQPAPSRTARPGVERGPLPPFFGSSAEAQKAEVVLVQPSSAGSGMSLPPTSQPAKAAASNGQTGPAAAPARPGPAGAQVADSLRNGAASGLFGHVASDARAAPQSATPHTHALEAMVAEMLRPMLQRWLDENMPRLVAAALKDEAARTALRNRDKP